jgi:hypothetical protein
MCSSRQSAPSFQVGCHNRVARPHTSDRTPARTPQVAHPRPHTPGRTPQAAHPTLQSLPFATHKRRNHLRAAPLVGNGILLAPDAWAVLLSGKYAASYVVNGTLTLEPASATAPSLHFIIFTGLDKRVLALPVVVGEA